MSFPWVSPWYFTRGFTHCCCSDCRDFLRLLESWEVLRREKRKMRTLGDRSIGLNRTWVKTQDDSCSFSQWEILYFENLQGIYRECVKKLGYLSKSKTINHSTRRSFSSNLSRISQLAMLEERSVAARSSFTAFNRMLGGSPQ